MDNFWVVIFWVVVLLWWSPRLRVFVLVVLPSLPGLLMKKSLWSGAADDGTVLRAKIRFHVGDPNSSDPAEVTIEMNGDMKYAPELTMWLAIRVVQDVDGLHKRSDLVCNLGVPEYIAILSDLDGQNGFLESMRALRLVPHTNKVVTCQIVVNLVDGGRSGLKWLAFVHLQGPVGDMAQVVAPLMLISHLNGILDDDQMAKVSRYMRSLENAPKFTPLDARTSATWANRVFDVG